MGRQTRSAEFRAAVCRDLIWVLLWEQSYDLGDGRWFRWVTSTQVYDMWWDGRTPSIFEPDEIRRDAVTRHLNRLVEDGRAVVSRAPGRHPWFQALRLPYDAVL